MDKKIASWMRANKPRFVDRLTGEVNMTEMVETWDRECSTGGATLDGEHPAWYTAYKVCE